MWFFDRSYIDKITVRLTNRSLFSVLMQITLCHFLSKVLITTQHFGIESIWSQKSHVYFWQSDMHVVDMTRVVDMESSCCRRETAGSIVDMKPLYS